METDKRLISKFWFIFKHIYTPNNVIMLFVGNAWRILGTVFVIS